MSYRPPVVVLDYETALLNGEPSTEYYRDDFRAVSAACAWRGSDGAIKTKFLEGEEAIRRFLLRLRRQGIPVVVHNYQFEYGVTVHRFADAEPVAWIDTMRLAQVADNGGKLYHGTVKLQTYDDALDAAEKGEEDSVYRAGLSLVACSSRFCPPEYHNHKEPYHAWLREHAGVKKGQEGRNLTKLPPDMFEGYNVMDAVVELVLFEALTAKLEAEGYDWRLDHKLYQSSARMISVAKGVGLPVDRAALQAYQTDIEAQVRKIEQDFRQRFAAEIAELEAERAEAWTAALKTAKGQARRRAELEEGGLPEELRFNVGSNKQLDALFRGKLGLAPQFWTKEPKAKPGKERKKAFVPSPSFKAAHLSTYGDGGAMLRERRKRLLVLTQTKALLGLTRYDGKWHFDIKACGTATGRFAGGRA